MAGFWKKNGDYAICTLIEDKSIPSLTTFATQDHANMIYLILQIYSC